MPKTKLIRNISNQTVQLHQNNKNDKTEKIPISQNNQSVNFSCLNAFDQVETTLSQDSNRKVQTDILSEYEQEIMKYILKRQNLLNLNENYIAYHKNFNLRARTVLIKYQYRIYLRFKLLPQTLHLAVYYMDKYLQKETDINQQEILITISQATLLIAMKYCQIYPPDLDQWVDKKHHRNIIKYQSHILKKINFELAYFTCQHFINYYDFKNKLKIDQETFKQIQLLIDVTLFDLKIHQYLPSYLCLEIIKSILIDVPLIEINHKNLPKNTVKKRKTNLNTQKNTTQINIKWMIQRNYHTIRWLQQVNNHYQTILR